MIYAYDVCRDVWCDTELCKNLPGAAPGAACRTGQAQPEAPPAAAAHGECPGCCGSVACGPQSATRSRASAAPARAAAGSSRAANITPAASESQAVQEQLECHTQG